MSDWDDIGTAIRAGSVTAARAISPAERSDRIERERDVLARELEVNRARVDFLREKWDDSVESLRECRWTMIGMNAFIMAICTSLILSGWRIGYVGIFLGGMGLRLNVGLLRKGK